MVCACVEPWGVVLLAAGRESLGLLVGLDTILRPRNRVVVVIVISMGS